MPKLNVPFTFNSDEEAIRALYIQGRRLKYIAVKQWWMYLNSYKPSEYVRTGNSQRAIKLGKVKRLDAFTFGIEISFADELSYHNSVVSKNGRPRGHSFMLISEGWTVKNRARNRKPVYRFDYFEGVDYISNVIKEFNQNPVAGIKLEVNWAGEPFKKQKKQRNVLK